MGLLRRMKEDLRDFDGHKLFRDRHAFTEQFYLGPREKALYDAVTRYIHLKVRDTHLADEVLQEFWTKLLTGKLAGADKNKGRFRDYLRTVLHRLIIDHFRVRKLQTLPPGDLLDASAPDEDF